MMKCSRRRSIVGGYIYVWGPYEFAKTKSGEWICRNALGEVLRDKNLEKCKEKLYDLLNKGVTTFPRDTRVYWNDPAKICSGEYTVLCHEGDIITLVNKEGSEAEVFISEVSAL